MWYYLNCFSLILASSGFEFVTSSQYGQLRYGDQFYSNKFGPSKTHHLSRQNAHSESDVQSHISVLEFRL